MLGFSEAISWSTDRGSGGRVRLLRELVLDGTGCTLVEKTRWRRPQPADFGGPAGNLRQALRLSRYGPLVNSPMIVSPSDS